VQRVVEVLVEVEGSEHDDLRRVASVREQAAGRLDPVEVGHANVQQDDVGTQVLRLSDRGRAVGGLADDLDVRFRVEDHPEAGADERLVVDNEDADLGLACFGARRPSAACIGTCSPPFRGRAA
jgi:hypothetical protein